MNLPARPANASSQRPAWFVAGLLALAALAAYHNTFHAPFIFDDSASIGENPTIQRLWPVWKPFLPPHGSQTVSGRPVLNFTLAINQALSGTEVWSYHLLNLLIHISAGLVLFGLVRRTLCRPGLRERFGDAALPLALMVTLLWTLHPLQTEAVTYVIQRAESLTGLFYLLTLYGFVRAMESPVQNRWYALSITSCVLGMATKEVMATAPVMVLLYDRTFVAGGFRAAWRQRKKYYLWLGATWLLLGYLVIANGGNRGGSIGFGLKASWWAHGLTQFQAIACYLRLSLWPHPLIFDYETFWVKQPADVIPYALVVGPLAVGTLVALWKRPILGFFGAWFFCILAPTSLMPATSQMIMEYRMYLSLAAIVVLAVMGAYIFLGKRSMIVLLGLAAGLGWLTERRNEDYRTVESLWRDTTVKQPANPDAHNDLGCALIDMGRIQEAIAQFNEALRLEPANADAHLNLGTALLRTGHLEEARAHFTEAALYFREALKLHPDGSDLHYNLGNALDQAGQTQEAISEYGRALRLGPDQAEIHHNLGNALGHAGRLAEAIAEYEQALRLQPDYAEAHNNLANLLLQTGRLPDAIAHFKEALRSKPDSAEIHYNLGNALAGAGQRQEAIAEYEQALRFQPGYAEAHNNLGSALLQAGRLQDALTQFQEAVRDKPDYTDARNNLGNALGQTGQLPEAIAEYEQTLHFQPDNADAHNNLANLLLQTGRLPDAIAHFKEALRSKPDSAGIHYNLGNALAGAGQREEAIAEYEETIRLQPDHAGAHNNLGMILADMNRLPEAITHFKDVVRIDPANVGAHLNLGSALYLTGQTNNAIAEFETALRLDPGSADAARYLAAARQAQSASP